MDDLLFVTALVSGLSELLGRASSLDDKTRRAVLVFGPTFFLANSAALVLSPFAYETGSLAVIYLVLFFSANLIPLLCWRAYLLKSYPAAGGG